MKNSIFKKIVSVLAVTAITTASSVVALAENDYASQSTTCDSAINWSLANDSNSGTGKITGGVFKAERHIFRTSNANKANYVGIENAEPVPDGSICFKASSDGTKWEAVTANTSNPASTYSFAGKTFRTGVVEANFDIMFEGGAYQNAAIEFAGSTGVSWSRLGIIISKGSMRFVWPNGTHDSTSSFTSSIVDDQWYTCKLKYDIDAQVLESTLTSKDDPTWTKTIKKSIPADKWPAQGKGAVSGVSFVTYRDMDSAEKTPENNPTSVWYVDNLSIDAFSKSNYAMSNVYKSDDGVVSNVESAAIPFKGVELKRLTNIADPANASFITAAYDSTGRMEEVLATPLSAVGTTPLHSAVTGNTVKSFVIDMDNARPYAEAYQQTAPTTRIRSIDFNDGCNVTAAKDRKNVQLQGYYENGVVPDVTATIENGALKFERSQFRASNKRYYYDENGNKVECADDNTSSNTQHAYMFRLAEAGSNETFNSAHVTLKFKFAGVDETNGGSQMMTFTFAKDNGNPGEYLLKITRNANGSGNVKNGFGGTGASWNAGEMKANTWYTLDFTYTYNVETSKATMTGTLTGDLLNETITVNDVQLDIPKNFNCFSIFSHREGDRASTATEGVTVKTSVWYIDDIVLEY